MQKIKKIDSNDIRRLMFDKYLKIEPWSIKGAVWPLLTTDSLAKVILLNKQGTFLQPPEKDGTKHPFEKRAFRWWTGTVILYVGSISSSLIT